MKPFIDNYEDILALLDEKVPGIEWDTFYRERNRQPPFIAQSTLPDENLVAFLDRGIPVSCAVEFGCGEGRNAIYMAKKGVAVTAYDLSEAAIGRARKNAEAAGAACNFICKDVIADPIAGQYDFVYDSGVLHHLPPHRRITYIELLNRLLKPGGYFGLTCFAWGEGCAEEIDDWAYYDQRFNAGLAFQKERLETLFRPHFEIMEIRKYRNGVPGTIQGLQFMWVCLFRRRGG